MPEIDKVRSAPEREARSFESLSPTGVLWALNRFIFHPQGYAIAIEYDGDGVACGWNIYGDGEEVWTFNPASLNEDDALALFKQTLSEALSYGDYGKKVEKNVEPLRRLRRQRAHHAAMAQDAYLREEAMRGAWQ